MLLTTHVTIAAIATLAIAVQTISYIAQEIILMRDEQGG